MLSLITINFNNADGLTKTIDSVVNQTLKSGFEHVIIDGLSSDNSLAAIESYVASHDNVKWISEPDTGIYNAMNKGIDQAEGTMIGFLNSGDVLASSTILDEIRNLSEDFSKFDVIYGDLQIVDLDGAVVRSWVSGEYSWFKVVTGWMPPHPMTLIKKSVLREVNCFNENYQIAADYQLLLKVLCRQKTDIKYFSKMTVKMEAGGLSNGSIKNIVKSNLEVIKAWRSTKLIITPYWIFIFKPIRKLFQYHLIKN